MENNQPISLSWEEQLNKFKSRGMQVGKTDFEKFKFINYYRFKELAAPFGKRKNGELVYENISFEDVLCRYYQDKNLRIHLFHAIEKIEIAIKTKISHVLGVKLGAFGYLNFDKWCDKKNYSKFEIEELQYKMKKSLLEKTKRSNILELYDFNKKTKDGFPVVWLAIDLYTFGEIVQILKHMNVSDLESIARSFNVTRKELLSWMQCIKFIRNVCAHNSNLIDIKITTKPTTRTSWDKYLKKVKLKKDTKITDRFALVYIIIVELIIVINPEYIFDRIVSVLVNLCKNEERAQLLGFSSTQSAECILEDIKKNYYKSKKSKNTIK